VQAASNAGTTIRRRAVFLDFDGTYADHGVVPDGHVLAVRAVREAGHRVFLCTGRPRSMILSSVLAELDGFVAAAEANNVATVVFFTDRFVESTRTWLDHIHESGGWLGGWMRWFSALQEPDNPFGVSPWRRQRGALWDTGPHALSTLGAALGPIDSITAVAGRGDLVSHATGATSTATLSQFAPPAATCVETTLWGEHGFSVMPPRPEDSSVAFRVAAQELVGSATSGQPHEVNVAFGARIVELLHDAQYQVDIQGRQG
jgi:hypothetical protein